MTTLSSLKIAVAALLISLCAGPSASPIDAVTADADGDPDLFITRPLNIWTSLFYPNNGNGTFQSMARNDVGDLVNDNGIK